MSAEAIAQTLAACARDGRTVVINGGKTLSEMGLPPERADVVLSTLQLDRIVEDAPADLTIAVEGGVTLRALATQLHAHGTFVPFDAPQSAHATVGGTLAAGWLGPRRHRYGRPRDFVIGTTAILADGTIAHAGGMVVKNVTGYDMSRLYVGSFGTLAVLAQINLKTIAAPDVMRMFHLRLPEGTRERALAQLHDSAIVPAAAFWIEGHRTALEGDDGDDGRLSVLIDGSSIALERATRDLRSSLGRAGVPETRIVDAGARESFERIVDAYTANVGERSITYRIHAFVDDAFARVDSLRALAARFELRSDTIVDLMNADIVFRIHDLDAHAFASKIEMFDDALHDDEPNAIIIAGAHPKRPLLAVWGAQPEAIDRMRALKERFDPGRILNRGRFIGGI
jgi:glycolate oxidase FAD binding subunit